MGHHCSNQHSRMLPLSESDHRIYSDTLTFTPDRYGRVDFTWMRTGSIQVVTHVQALPFLSLPVAGATANPKVLVAFVLLVLLTMVQLAVVIYSLWTRMTQAASWQRMMQVSQTCPGFIHVHCIHCACVPI